MKIHDEERDIYGTVTVEDGNRYFLLEPRPYREREWWMVDGMNKWLVANVKSNHSKKMQFDDGEDYVPVYDVGYLVFGSSATIELLPVPLTKKVIRFYITDDEEA